MALGKLNLNTMNLPFMKKQTLTVGLDIGSHSIKICELSEHGKGGLRLISLGSARLPSDAVEKVKAALS